MNSQLSVTEPRVSQTGAFVVFEGGDGVGKSTQLARLASWLSNRGFDVVSTHQPGGTSIGQEIRSLLLDPAATDFDPRAEALLYAADKAQHLAQVVRPALAAGRIVLCDRYVDSMVAYQGAGRVLDPGEVSALAGWATGSLRPHLTILLDGDPADLVASKVSKDRLEDAGIELHRRVRDALLSLAGHDPERALILPARQSKDSITEAITARVERLLVSLSVPGATITS